MKTTTQDARPTEVLCFVIIEPPREKRAAERSAFFVWLLRAIRDENITSQKGGGVVPVASFQASDYILDIVRLIACHGGNQENGGCLRLSIFSFIRQQLS